MSKIQKHTLTLRSPRTDAAEHAYEELAYLEGQSARIQAAALSGNLSAEALAAHNDRLNLAKLRADAARAAADQEAGELAKANTIADAIAELLDDPSLSTTGIDKALDDLRNALAALDASNTERNGSITNWVQRLRALGVPDIGLTVNDDEIRIQSSGTTGTTITIGAGAVTTIGSTAEYVKHLAQPHASRARMAIDPSNITRADTRGRNLGAVTSVRLLHNLGGYQAGDVLTTRTHTLGVLAKFVHDGDAELIEGEIPAPSDYQRKSIPVDSRAQGPVEYQAPSTVGETAAIEEAVARAFAR